MLRRLSRRRFLRGTAATAGWALATGAITGFPYVRGAEAVTLRIAGTGVNQFKELADKCKADLGFTVQYTSLVSDDVVKRAVTQPSSFDLLDSEYWMLKKIVPSGNLRGIDVTKIKYYEEIVPIFTKGELPNGKKVAMEGISPIKVAYLTAENSEKFAPQASQWMTVIPTVYNADTLGIRPDLIKQPIESWAELLNPEFKGKTSILNIPSIGIMDAAMVCEAKGLVSYSDKGNMTTPEIDKTIAVLTDAKKAGQFRAFWKEFNESVNLMASGEVVIQSMWSPAVTAVKTRGIPCVYQPLKEGFRGWGYTLAPMKHLAGLKLDCFYEYMNWYTSGFQGAFIAREGYYSSVPENAKKFLTQAEWDYWYGGKPAATDITDPFGKLMEKAGGIRDGGAFWDRLGNIAVWNSVMDEDRYLTRRWNEFITT